VGRRTELAAVNCQPAAFREELAGASITEVPFWSQTASRRKAHEKSARHELWDAVNATVP
jgi:hypothetical protein